MITKLVGVATLFAASSILVAGNPTLGAKGPDNQVSPASPQGGGPGAERRCGGGGGRRCGGRRCGGGGGRACAVPACATRRCATWRR
jgi:hypothetical protein